MSTILLTAAQRRILHGLQVAVDAMPDLAGQPSPVHARHLRNHLSTASGRLEKAGALGAIVRVLGTLEKAGLVLVGSFYKPRDGNGWPGGWGKTYAITDTGRQALREQQPGKTPRTVEYPRCHGTGKLDDQICARCDGSGDLDATDAKAEPCENCGALDFLDQDGFCRECAFEVNEAPNDEDQ